jgi:hypothetical protein
VNWAKTPISALKFMGNLTNEFRIPCSNVEWVLTSLKLVVFNLSQTFNGSRRNKIQFWASMEKIEKLKIWKKLKILGIFPYGDINMMWGSLAILETTMGGPLWF